MEIPTLNTGPRTNHLASKRKGTQAAKKKVSRDALEIEVDHLDITEDVQVKK